MAEDAAGAVRDIRRRGHPGRVDPAAELLHRAKDGQGARVSE
ncbi:hypothetical protein [Cryobacterium sp. TMT2-10]|nr:hypothetical protein [Cryobacterium sp. TMT2-10]